MLTDEDQIILETIAKRDAKEDDVAVLARAILELQQRLEDRRVQKPGYKMTWHCPGCSVAVIVDVGEAVWYEGGKVHTPGGVIHQCEQPLEANRKRPGVPKLGDKATCEMCDHEIEYIGPYWRHTGGFNPRHPGMPKK